MSNYKIVTKIGAGTFGNVYLLKIMRSQGSKTKFALKTVDMTRLSHKEEKSLASEEGLLMLKLCHAHLVHCYDAFVCNQRLFLVLELCSHDSLHHYLHERKSLVLEEQICLWFSQMADVLRYLHTLKIIHRDLKPANIFLDRDHDIKLGDLGVARELDNTMQERQTVVGTLSYMSPEVFNGIPYNYKTDIWSLGCCIHEVMTLNKTFQGQSWVELHHLITSAKIPSISSIYHRKLRQLVLSLLNTNPSQRPDALEILHSLFQIQGRRFTSDSVPSPTDIQLELDQRQIFLAVKTFEMSSENDDITPLRADADTDSDTVKFGSFVTNSTDNSSTDYTDQSTESSTSSSDQLPMKKGLSTDAPRSTHESQRPLPILKSKKKKKILESEQKKTCSKNMETEELVEDVTKGCHNWLQSRCKTNIAPTKDSAQVNEYDDDDEDEVPSGLVTLFTQAQTAVYINQRDPLRDKCDES